MEKKFNSRTIAQVKNLFKANEAEYNKIDKLNEKITELQTELEMTIAGIESVEARVKALTGGYTSRDLIQAVRIPLINEDGTPKLDKNGYAMYKKQYMCKYPETFLPPIEVTVENVNIDTLAPTDAYVPETEGTDQD